MGVERAAQVLHDVLADDVVEVALADADQARDDRQHDHQPDVQVQLLVVAADDHLVEQEPEQERVDQADEARRQDRDQDDEHLEPVRPEEGDDPPERRGAPLLRHRVELLGGAAPHAPAHASGPAPAAASGRAAGCGARATTRKRHQVLLSIRPTLAREFRMRRGARAGTRAGSHLLPGCNFPAFLMQLPGITGWGGWEAIGG